MELGTTIEHSKFHQWENSSVRVRVAWRREEMANERWQWIRWAGDCAVFFGGGLVERGIVQYSFWRWTGWAGGYAVFFSAVDWVAENRAVSFLVVDWVGGV